MLRFLFLLVAIAPLTPHPADAQFNNNRVNGMQMRPIQCFSCLSGTLSDQSRAMFDQSGRVQQRGPVDVCDDPFQPMSQLLQPCQTSCVKSVSENQYTRIVLRGCLSEVGQQLTGRNPGMQLPPPGQCTEYTTDSPQLGRVTTRTCLCENHGCNGALSSLGNSFLTVVMGLAALAGGVFTIL